MYSLCVRYESSPTPTQVTHRQTDNTHYERTETMKNPFFTCIFMHITSSGVLTPYALRTQRHLVSVSHVAPSPHLFDHQVPEFGFCFQIGLERLLPSTNPQLQAGDPQQQEGSRGHLHLLKSNVL